MKPGNTPMQWPAAWKDVAPAEFLKGTAIEVVDPAAAGAGVTVAKGVWPGVRMSRGSGGADAGPTGVAWVDSNGWLARLTSVRNPGSSVWIDAAPDNAKPTWPFEYLIVMADAAAFGARWMISLDDSLAAKIAAREERAMAAWRSITAASRFFADRHPWVEWRPEALLGVLSDFTGDNDFLAGEALNLLDRAGAHNRILLKDRLPAAPFDRLRAVLYADQQPPSATLRRQVLNFVEGGGLLITTPVWGRIPGTPAKYAVLPGYAEKQFGKGRLAIAKEPPDDPYVLANDSMLLVSHRYDLVRCFNSGAFASHYTVAPGGAQAVVHLLFYAGRGPDAASVRVSGRWRSAAISTVDEPAPKPVKLAVMKDAVEVYLPQVSQYVALQLEG
jgi:hypothetical protein